jgi:hypothetical protein
VEAAMKKAFGPTVGDIVQVVANPHKHMASIWIVHAVNGNELICYQPQKGGRPMRFTVDKRDAQVVGRAKLLYKKELTNDNVYADNSLDKI